MPLSLLHGWGRCWSLCDACGAACICELVRAAQCAAQQLGQRAERGWQGRMRVWPIIIMLTCPVLAVTEVSVHGALHASREDMLLRWRHHVHALPWLVESATRANCQRGFACLMVQAFVTTAPMAGRACGAYVACEM